MKRVVISGKRNSEIIDVAIPEVPPGWALVKTIVVPLCTEYKQYNTGKPNFPLGHEAAGEIVDVTGTNEINVGDRVVVMPQYPCGQCLLCLKGEYIHCEHILDLKKYNIDLNGADTFAQYILKPSWLLPKIPADISYEHAAMICCGLGPTFGAFKRMNLSSNDTVLITGLGPVGLGGIIHAISTGCRVIGITANRYRADLAKKIGAETVIDPGIKNIPEIIRELTNGNGADVSLDCAGNQSAQKILIASTKRNGKIAFIGESDNLNLHVSDDLIRNGLTLFGIWHYNMNDIPALFKIVIDNKKLLDIMITHFFPFNKIEEAWELQSGRQCGKLIVYPWDMPDVLN
jgi:L-iditol 2-dehydrogenase